MLRPVNFSIGRGTLRPYNNPHSRSDYLPDATLSIPMIVQETHESVFR